MDEITYSKQALRTDLSDEQYAEAIQRATDPAFIRLNHAASGMVTEAGELEDGMKRYLYYGKPMDFVNMKEELGDLFWYANLMAHELSLVTGDPVYKILEEIREKNIAKLRNRFPDKFSGEDALARDTYAERMILEGRCPKCGHAAHGEVCYNLGSDNDCECHHVSINKPYDSTSA